jgi:hypothetical protein
MVTIKVQVFTMHIYLHMVIVYFGNSTLRVLFGAINLLPNVNCSVYHGFAVILVLYVPVLCNMVLIA